MYSKYTGVFRLEYVQNPLGVMTPPVSKAQVQATGSFMRAHCG